MDERVLAVWLRHEPSRPDPNSPGARRLRERLRAHVAEEERLKRAEARTKESFAGRWLGRLRTRPPIPYGFAGQGRAYLLSTAVALTGVAAIVVLIGWSANDFRVPGSGTGDLVVRTELPSSAEEAPTGRTGDHRNGPTADPEPVVAPAPAPAPAKPRAKRGRGDNAAAPVDATSGFPVGGSGSGAADPPPDDSSPGSGGKPDKPNEGKPTSPPTSTAPPPASSPPPAASPPASSPGSWTETGVQPPDGGGAGGVDSGIGG
jgi:hypothetical protein